jgi:prolyl oligopeptidase
MTNNPKKRITLLFVIIVLISCKNKMTEDSLTISYPVLKPNPVTETYFGKVINDDFRFLENDTNYVINKWISQERNLCDSILNRISLRDTIEKNLEDVVYSSNIRGGFPRVVDKKLFFTRIYVKEKIQKIFYRDSLNSMDIELFSTEYFKEKNKDYYIDFFEPSYNGQFLVLGISSNGDEMTKIKIIDVAKKVLLPESIERATYGNPMWLPQENAFFYTQLKEIKTESDLNTMYENSQVKLHLINTDPINDKVVFSKKTNKELKLNDIDFSVFCVYPSSDKIISFTALGSTMYKTIYYTQLNNLYSNSKPENIIWKTICTPEEKISVFTLNKNILFAISFKNNPNGTLIKYDLSNDKITESVILEGEKEVFEDLLQTKQAIYLKKLKNGVSEIVEISLNTSAIKKVDLPFQGNVNLKPFFDVASSYLHSDNLFFSMESWNKELAIYCYNSKNRKTVKTDLRKQGKYSDLDNIIVKEVEVMGYDGELIPLSIVYLEGTKLNGENPTLLDAYGAYGISINSVFYLPRLTWLKIGGIYAVAHVRGGGEKGDTWYKGGYKSTKPNSWKDFISCAEYLIKEKYTSPNKLAAKGTSAGCITVGRAITEKPELFKAAILEVGALNMLRSENSNNTFSVSEFGSIKDSIGFHNLYEMDVYHHIKKNVKYPSLLITAGLNDSRVDWWQPAKTVARFQELADNKNNIILFKINAAGHSGITNKVLEETEYICFLLWQLNHPDFKLN